MMKFMVRAWYQQSLWLHLLRPLSALFERLSDRRRKKYQRNAGLIYHSKAPVIIVGNISVGGTGKTPLTIYLARMLRERGYSPGIVSRGYGSKRKFFPYAVTASSTSADAGDEALVISRHAKCPLVIGPDRVAAVKRLESVYRCDVILSDDGLQHYALGRTVEIAVIDGARGFGNGFLLPAGPLRERPERLEEVDFIVCNGATRLDLPASAVFMETFNTRLVQAATGLSVAVEDGGRPAALSDKVHAVTGIGNPARFFSSLCDCGFDIISHIHNDHHVFKEEDIKFDDELDVVMTEKDAVKCEAFVDDRHWYLTIEATMPEQFNEELLQMISKSQTISRIREPWIRDS